MACKTALVQTPKLSQPYHVAWAWPSIIMHFFDHLMTQLDRLCRSGGQEACATKEPGSTVPTMRSLPLLTVFLVLQGSVPDDKRTLSLDGLLHVAQHLAQLGPPGSYCMLAQCVVQDGCVRLQPGCLIPEMLIRASRTPVVLTPCAPCFGSANRWGFREQSA